MCDLKPPQPLSQCIMQSYIRKIHIRGKYRFRFSESPLKAIPKTKNNNNYTIANSFKQIDEQFFNKWQILVGNGTLHIICYTHISVDIF